MLHLLHQAVDRAAARDPEHEAIRCGSDNLSYAELVSQSTRLARVLRDQGVGRGDRVGIYASKGVRSAVAIYGIMRAGAAYVPLDPFSPRRRLELIIRDCGIRHVVSEPAKADMIAELVAAGVGLDAVVGMGGIEAAGSETDGAGPGASAARFVSWADVDTAPEHMIDERGATELDLSYVLYTSGSTGVPKGVMHTHRSALSWAEVSAHTYGFRPEDRLSNHAPLHFDLSTLDYFATAVAGATTVVIPEAYTRMPASLSKLIQDERLTVLYAVPLALTHLLLYGALEDRDLSSVRWVLFGGEPFSTKHLRALMHALPDARFSNVYGPTEVNGVTYWPVPPIPEDSDDPIPIGHPFPNVETRIVDAADQPVAPGSPGELLARTPTMMMGYWGRPDLNARAFWQRPAFEIYEHAFHRTGDLVQEREDGALMFLGRKDRQIKTRGYRVELDEVEAALSSHEGVETAAVFSVPDAEGSQRILAAAKLHKTHKTVASELLEHAATILPSYALPERIDVRGELPHTSTGKIDRLALRNEAMSSAGAPEGA